MAPYMLVVGYRKQLAKALNKMGIPYSVWSEKPLKAPPPGADLAIVAPFSGSIEAFERQIEELGLTWSPTHILACTEAAVFPAAYLRRIYQAKRSPESLLVRCTDKTAMKHYLSKYTIPMTAFVEHKSGLTAKQIVDALGLPVVVKDRRNSGGRNIVVAKSLDEVDSQIARGRLYEAFVDGPEGSIESFIQNGEIIFSSVTEYYAKGLANIVPAGYEDSEIQQIRSLNRQVISAMKIEWGLTHLEYYRTAAGLLFGEIALRPPGGHIMDLIEMAFDFDPWEVFAKTELGEKIDKLPEAHQNVAGCVVLHPGEGKVKRVEKPSSSEFPTLLRSSLKIKPGEHVRKRQGLGEDVGHCLFKSNSYESLAKDIQKLLDSKVVELR